MVEQNIQHLSQLALTLSDYETLVYFGYLNMYSKKTQHADIQKKKLKFFNFLYVIFFTVNFTAGSA